MPKKDVPAYTTAPDTRKQNIHNDPQMQEYSPTITSSRISNTPHITPEQPNIIGLQRSLGNQAVQRLLVPYSAIQRKKPDTKKFSTPLEKGATSTSSGDAQFNVAADGRTVATTVQPDVFDLPKDSDAITSLELQWAMSGYKTDENGKIASFSPYKITLMIQTHYAEGEDTSADAAYGRGTTAEDKKAGTTSLKFHEGRHGSEAITYLKNPTDPRNPKKKAHDLMPTFQGKVGMTEEEFTTKMTEFEQAMDTYQQALKSDNYLKVDCVGTKEDACQ